MFSSTICRGNQMKSILRISLTMLIFSTLWLLIGCAADEKDIVVKLSDQEEPLILKHSGETLSDVLTNNGKNLAELKQKYEPSVPWNTKVDTLEEITLRCKCKVNVHIGGKKVGTYETTKTTVGEFLQEKKIPITPWDVLKTKPERKIVNGMNVIIDKVETKVSKKVEEIPFKSEEKKSDQLTKGKKEVKKKGTKGKKIYEVVVTYYNGKPLMKDGEPVTEKRLVKEIKPVDELILVGTKPEEEETQNQSTPSQTAPSGGRVMVVQATGYTHTGNRTATGTIPRRGTIAVDPRVIPLGTRIYVPGYGYGVAEDTGGAVNGRIIDLFFNTRTEAINWGRRTVQIKILD